MHWHLLIVFAPLVATLLWAAAEDLRTRTIPNWLTLGMVVMGLMQSFSAYGTVSPWASVGGLLVGGALNLFFYLINARGGGDVKLLAAAGAWLGPTLVVQVFLAAAIVGMVLVLGQVIVQGKLIELLRNTFKVLVSLLNVHRLGVEQLFRTARECQSVRRPLPHAVPVLLATVLVLVAGRGIL